MGCCFCRGDYFRRREYGLGLLFVLWTLVCGWLRGEIDRSAAAQTEFLRGLVLWGLIFPFAHLTGDRDRKLLEKLLLPVLVGMAALYGLTYIALLRGADIVLIPEWLVFGAAYTTTGRMMLKFLNLYHTCAGYLAVVCFYGALYLAVTYRKTRWLPAWLLLLTVFGIGVLITYSRTAVFTLTGGVLFAVYLYLQRHPMKPVLKVLTLILTAVAALAVGLIRSGRILLTSPKAELEDKFLLCLPVACLLMGAVESVIFLCTIPTELMVLLLMPFSGYTFERARQLSE